ncbi:uncharacterized protein LOC127857228 [Dreissena polymorpha]|uniref:uncharacterized protein LOC127857228 n=1 Tax=Dreissena polymorpha TaxID=45954 RepID=UPI002264AEE5|nr:uncharacterized protein LOC127857228 [Dreissena polymorpha]
MCPGISDDLLTIDDSRKTAIIDRELTRMDICITALQETRLSSSGSLREENYTFFWKGREPEQPLQHGVGFAVKYTLLASIESPTGGTERILTHHPNSAAGLITIFSVFAPTLGAFDEDKDTFYDQLDSLLGGIPKVEPILLLGDFNARVGTDHQSWSSCIGHYCTGKMNDNGQRLLELCSYHNLCITNTFFQSKPQHRVSWMDPRSRRWHQLDLVITRRSLLSSVLGTRSYHSADCDSDHALVCSRMRFLPASYIAPNPQKEEKNPDWFNANLQELEPVLATKRSALLAYRKSPCEKTLSALRTARSNAQRIARRCANDYWLQLCESIQRSADCGNVRGMYDGIKKAVGPTVKKTAPLKSSTGETITDRNHQMRRWVEHYSELYSSVTVVIESAINAISDLPVMEELDAIPTVDELAKAIDSLSDGIPPEAITCEKTTLLQPLHDLLLLCWEEGAVPQDMRDASIVTLYKNKGDRSDCNKYRGISLLSVVEKVFARLALNRLQTLAARIYPESQCGFRSGRSITDMIFTVRQLQEKCKEQGMPLYLAFIDLTKAYDLVSKPGLFRIWRRMVALPSCATW